MPSATNWLKDRKEFVWILPVLTGSLAVFAIGQAVGMLVDVSAVALVSDYSRKVLRASPQLLSVLLMIALIKGMIHRSKSPLGDLRRAVQERLASPALTLAACLPLLLMPVMFSGYGALKLALPSYAPFGWDDSFAAIDSMLFGGTQPWVLTHALFGGAAATRILDVIYTAWVLLLSVAIVGFALFMPRYDRARFFLAFTAAWILLGVIGAWLFSSAGPCYADRIGAASAAEFAPLMDRLRFVSETQGPLGAVHWQEVLWAAHSENRPGFGMGISAMPSLHNAIAVLYALALARFGRGAAISGWLFAAAIFVGSVHLGWHYAIDGVIAGVAMVGIWWASGRYLARFGYASESEAADAEALLPIGGQVSPAGS